MTASTSTSSKPPIVDVDIAALEPLLERVKVQVSSEDYACLDGLVRTLIELTRQVRQKGTTIARLRRFLGWSSSEKTADVLGNKAPAQAEDGSQTEGDNGDGAAPGAPDDPDAGDASTGDANSNPDDSDAKRGAKGHGRIAASDYQNARHIDVPHESLHAGDLCPGCAHGNLYPLPEPARIVRIVGQSPLAAHCWNCQRLRCGGCGHVYTAKAPAEAQGPKYSETAASMMALLRYGAGMPLNRLDRLQRNLQTPLPASTQWEVVRDRVAALQPVYDELRRQAAAGSVLHNDDTHARILELMGKRRAALLAAGELPDPERTGLFTTGVVSLTSAGPVALFFTGRKHAGENLKIGRAHV